MPTLIGSAARATENDAASAIAADIINFAVLDFITFPPLDKIQKTAPIPRQTAVSPPSTITIEPVMYEASSDARKAMAPDISSGWAPRFNGMDATSGSYTAGSATSSATMGDNVKPGTTTFTRMPSGA